jgi:hypothetical protein
MKPSFPSAEKTSEFLTPYEDLPNLAIFGNYFIIPSWLCTGRFFLRISSTRFEKFAHPAEFITFGFGNQNGLFILKEIRPGRPALDDAVSGKLL